jgi:hypothetical protein
MNLCGNIQRLEMPNVTVAISTDFLPAGTVKRGRERRAKISSYTCMIDITTLFILPHHNKVCYLLCPFSITVPSPHRKLLAAVTVQS